mmetsp:Transcript_123321/g.237758  ORF Transcript_123321/g.237758 Transcript_123321/m.237758 type:complete len:537 (+) Transcript_123321:3-1613(+)
MQMPQTHYVPQSGAYSVNTAIGVGDWACEQVLYTPWVHLGELRAAHESRLLALDANQFGEAAPQKQMNGHMAAAAARIFSKDQASTQTVPADNATAAADQGTGNDDTELITCAELPIPAQYITLLDEEDLQEIERLTGVEISVEEPEAGSSDTDWKLTVFGSAEGRAEVHKIVERTLNERLASRNSQDEADEAPTEDGKSDMTELPNVQSLDDSREVGAFSHQSSLEASVGDERVVGTAEATPSAQLAEPTAKDSNTAAAIDVPHARVLAKVEKDDKAARAEEAARAADAARAIDGENISTSRKAVPCTVLPIAADHMNLLFNEDLWQIRKITGCQAYVSDPGRDGGSWEIRLYGDPKNRDHARVIVEDTLKDRLAARGGVTPEGYAFETPPVKRVSFSEEETAVVIDKEPEKPEVDVGVSFPLDTITETPTLESEGLTMTGDVEDVQPPAEETPQKVLVPCTVLPITLEYLRMLKDLDKIQEQTGCQIQVSEPDPAGTNTGWQLSLFGTAEARQQAHHAIEDALTAAVAESANSE